MKFQDYYKTLDVPRDATKEQIGKAYKKLARKLHPDVNKEKDAEDKFKQLNEANEVLSDPEKRAKYDELGENWRAGQEFRPPPGWESMFQQAAAGAGSRRRSRSAGGQTQQFHFSGGGANGFSDFFEALFGAGGGMGEGMSGGAGTGRMFTGGGAFRRDGENKSASMTISLEDAFHGATKRVTVPTTEINDRGLAELKTKTLNIKIPPGATEGKVIRLRGMGSKGTNGGENGDLLLSLHVASNPRFRVDGKNLVTTVPITSSEAALGAKVTVKTMDGSVVVSIPPGSQSDQRLRLKGKGLPAKGSESGDLLAELKITVPKSITEEERKLYEQLAETSKFNPRDE